MPLAIAALALVVALVQRPGVVVADTKVDLHLDPVRFLERVTAVWSPTADLGHLQGAQYGGYLWPMGPWFAAGDLAGLPAWLTHRLWLAALLALAGVGVVKLLDALLPPRRTLLHGAAAALYIVNPYVTVTVNRTSVALLAHAALPWLLLLVHRGLREPRSLRAPAAIALVVASAGGGVNAATVAWVLAGPVVLALYEVGWGGVRARAVWALGWRAVLLGAIASAWWLVPLAIQARGAPSFLEFSEQPGTIWSVTSIPESLRLMGFWTSYVGVGYDGVLRPFASHGNVLLFVLPVVLAGLAVPVAALLATGRTARARYIPFFALLLLAGLAIMVAGWPDGAPLRRAITQAYYRFDAIQPLRTTYKAGPLVALGVAVLAGAGLAALPRRRTAAVVALAAVAALAAWPLVTGRALEAQLRLDDVPPAWRQVARELDARPDDGRAVQLPGQLFGYRDWGGTVDPVLPVLTDHPVATRWIVPYEDRRATELFWAVDGLVAQGRVRAGQLPPLLDLLGATDLVVPLDGDRARSGEPPAWRAAAQLPHAGRVRRTALDGGGLVRLLPRGADTVVDGGASAYLGLAALGALRTDQAHVAAPDRTGSAGPAGEVVVADGDRRRAFVASRPRLGVGPTLPADEAPSIDGAQLDPWPGVPGAQTTAELRGVRRVSAPASPQVTQFPDRRPFAALDGDPRTAWLADRTLAPDRRVLTVDLGRAVDVPHVDVLPYSDSRGVVREVEVAGRRARVGRGWTRVRVGRRLRTIAIALTRVGEPREASAAGGGLRELRIPGVRAQEWLRAPSVAERTARSERWTYLLERVTAAAPWGADRLTGERGAFDPRDARDPERRLRRVIAPPVAGGWRLDGLASPHPDTPDTALDALAGLRSGVTSSSREGGAAAHRGAMAFDGDPATAWVGQWLPGRPAWLRWTTGAPRTVRRLELVPARGDVRRPTRVALSAGGERVEAAVRDGVVVLPRALRGRAWRLEVLAAHGATARARWRRAVALAEVRGTGVRVRRVARPDCAAGVVRVGGSTVRLAVRGDLDVARVTACSEVRAPAGRLDVEDLRGPLRLDLLRLRRGAGRPAAAAGRVRDAGTLRRAGRDGVRVQVDRPAWLVLAHGYDTGWRAACDGRDLGPPTPVQGYANGWPVAPGCTDIAFRYGPQRAVDAGYVVSGAGLLGLLALAAWPRRRRRAPAPAAPADLADPPAPAPVSAPRAAALGLLVALACGAAFGLRAGAVLGPAAALVLWRAVGDRTLLRVAAVLLLVAVPVAYLVAALVGENPGGYGTDFAADRIAAHWLALGGLAALVIPLARRLRHARRG